MKNERFQPDQIAIKLTAYLSILISILDWSGLLENVRFLSNKIPTMTLLVLGLTTIVLIKRETKLDKIEKIVEFSMTKVINSLNGVQVKTFADSTEFLDYVTNRINETDKTIDDVSWGSGMPKLTSSEEKSFVRYTQAISNICRKGKRYREVMSFNSHTHIVRAEELFAKNLPCYNLKYYSFDRSTTPPLIQFLVIDSEEVIFAFYRWPILDAENEVRLSIKHPDIVRLFQDYFETIWQGAKPLKLGGDVQVNILKELKEKINKYNQDINALR